MEYPEGENKSKEDGRKLFRFRKRWHHLCQDQIDWIKLQIEEKSQSIRDMCQRYEVSESTIKRIIKNESTKDKRAEILPPIRYHEWLRNHDLISWMREYIKTTTTAFTCKDLRCHVYSNIQILIPFHVLRRLLVEKFGLSFKKTWSRPIKLDVKRHPWMKALFWVNILKMLPRIQLIVNMDEMLLSRSLKVEYSWTVRGNPGWIRNTRFSDSANLISAITSDGWSLTSVHSNTINSKAILSYLCSLMEYITKNTPYSLSNCLLVMDNCPTHHAKIVLDFLQSARINVVFLPTYTPELAPVEQMLRSFKERTKRNQASNASKFLSNDGSELIISTIKMIRRREIMAYWRSFISQLRKCIEFIRHSK